MTTNFSVSISSSAPAVGQKVFDAPVDVGARPAVWLGAPSMFGLALPDASPTPSQMYAPRGVYFDDEILIACDTGNHRVLIWQGVPDEDHAEADVVLGQPDFTSEGPNAGGRGSENGVHLPTGWRFMRENCLWPMRGIIGFWCGRGCLLSLIRRRVMCWVSRI